MEKVKLNREQQKLLLSLIHQSILTESYELFSLGNKSPAKMTRDFVEPSLFGCTLAMIFLHSEKLSSLSGLMIRIDSDGQIIVWWNQYSLSFCINFDLPFFLFSSEWRAARKQFKELIKTLNQKIKERDTQILTKALDETQEIIESLSGISIEDPLEKQFRELLSKT